MGTLSIVTKKVPASLLMKRVVKQEWYKLKVTNSVKQKLLLQLLPTMLLQDLQEQLLPHLHLLLVLLLPVLALFLAQSLLWDSHFWPFWLHFGSDYNPFIILKFQDFLDV